MTDAGLISALARCQGKFPPIVKRHQNEHFKSQFADVADVLAAVRPVLAEAGICVMQRTMLTDDGVVLVTSLLLGDEELTSHFPLQTNGATAQQVGSLLTYHRRYQLCALLGVHPEGDDDDGNAAQSAPPRQTPRERGFPQHGQPVVVPPDDGSDIGNAYAMAAANPPEKPLAAMTAVELLRYGTSIGVHVSGNKTDLVRALEPYVLAASGEDPFLVASPTTSGRPGDGDGSAGEPAQSTAASPPPSQPLFSPVVAKPHTTATERAHRDQVEADIREGR